MAVRIKAFERHVASFIVPFHDGYAIGLHAFHQRVHVGWLCGFEAGMQNAGDGPTSPNRMQSQIEPVDVADDDSAVLILLAGGRAEAK